MCLIAKNSKIEGANLFTVQLHVTKFTLINFHIYLIYLHHTHTLLNIQKMLHLIFTLPRIISREFFSVFWILLGSGYVLNAQPIYENPREKSEFNQYFDECGVKGTTLIADRSGKVYTNDLESLDEFTLPASSFKIINLLIALETNVIANENEVIKWPGSTDTTLYGYRPDIYKDMTVKEAFRVSAGWAFMEIANRVGKKQYQQLLAKAGYGNGKVFNNSDDFWNFGEFGVTPRQQLEFLMNLYYDKLSFSKKNMAIVREVMKDEVTESYSVHAKTGWTREGGINTGWWVGYIEKENDPSFFVTKLLQDRKNNRKDFGNCRKTITRKILEDLKVI